MKKTVCTILVLVMVMTVLSGCANTNTDMPSASNSDKVYTSEAELSSTYVNVTTLVQTSISTIEENPGSSTEPNVDESLVNPMDSELTDSQKNSVAMLNYLAMVSQKIESSKHNRIYLEEVYSSLLNNTNPVLDKKTQDHVLTLLTIIKDYRQLELKRERLQYIYEQDKANSIKSAMPSPMAVLNIVQSSDWKKLVASVLYTAVSSYTNYQSANDSLDKQFMLDGWDLDDEETETIHRNRTRTFNYMVEIVRDYNLDGYLALNEDFVSEFVDQIANTNTSQRLQYLRSHKEIYAAFGPYWLEMAKCYYELENYQSCLNCISNYESVSTDIFRYDYQYAEYLPMAIFAAQSVFAENMNEYVSVIEEYTATLNSPYQTKWELRYFAAQSYMDLYAKTNNIDYLWKAYEIAKDNVNSLAKGQEELNSTYLNDVKKLTLSESDTKLMSKDEVKVQKKELKKLNKSLAKKRKTELPELYEPLVVNCELLFELANELNISNNEKNEINGILSGVFIVDPVSKKYSFDATTHTYSIGVTEDEILIPADIITNTATITVKINNYLKISEFVPVKVERTDNTISSFVAHYESKEFESFDWMVGDRFTITISNGDSDSDIVFDYEVKEIKSGIWYFIKGIFGSDKAIFECIS